MNPKLTWPRNINPSMFPKSTNTSLARKKTSTMNVQRWRIQQVQRLLNLKMKEASKIQQAPKLLILLQILRQCNLQLHQFQEQGSTLFPLCLLASQLRQHSCLHDNVLPRRKCLCTWMSHSPSFICWHDFFKTWVKPAAFVKLTFS